MESPFFIVGTGRCGTQMLRNILTTNKKIKIMPETHFVSVLYDKFKLEKINFTEFWEIIDGVYDSKGSKWIDIILKDENKEKGKFLNEFKQGAEKIKNKNIKTLLNYMYAKIYGENILLGDKTPHYGLELSNIKKIWPDAKIIHITRDGVDAALSMIKHNGFIKIIGNNINPDQIEKITYKKSVTNLPDYPIKIEQAIKFWDKIILLIFEEYKKINNDDIITIKYENLLLFPRKTIKKIVNFLKLDPNGKWIKNAVQIPRPFPEKKQIKKLSDREYEFYYKISRDGMIKAGYPYNFNIKRSFIKTIKEIYRGRKYYLTKINPINIIKNARKNKHKHHHLQ